MSLIVTGCASQHMKPTVHGIDNFGEVLPGIYRGGQPTSKEGWDYLASLGVTNVVKLNSDAEGKDDSRFTIYSFPILFSHQLIFQPSESLVAGAVNAIGPNTFIHCTHGQDRTGLIVGEYRVNKCNWGRMDARREMGEYGFHAELFGLEHFWEDN